MKAPYQLLPMLTEDEYDALKASIAKHGYDPAHPIVVDEAGAILDGHHRQMVCRELGIAPPTVTRSGLTEQQKLEYALSANLRRRHLGQAERQALVRRLGEENGWSVRRIERATGIPKSTVARYLAPVPSGTPGAPPQVTKAEAERITEEIRRQLWWMDVLTMQGLVMGVAPARLARQLIPPGDFLANQPEARDAWELIITHPRLDGLYAWPAGGHYRTVALEVIAWPEWGDSEDRALVEAARRELGELGELQASPA